MSSANEVEARFWAKVDKDGPLPRADTLAAGLGPCWLWTDAPDGHGYGQISIANRRVGAHRFSYELANGPIPEGLEPDHLCRVSMCVNPSHLEAVTPEENHRRCRTRFCQRGHEFTPENTLVKPDGRRCRKCQHIGYITRKQRTQFGVPAEHGATAKAGLQPSTAVDKTAEERLRLMQPVGE